MLIILSRDGDLHADWVEAECARRGVPCLRLCPRQFPQEIGLTLTLMDGSLEGYVQLPGGGVLIEQITGVWYRRPEAPEPHPDLDEAYAQFVGRESRETLYGLYRTLWDRRWVNPPHHDEAAHSKIRQLGLAQEIGFQTPRTLVTNEPQEASDFFYACGKQMVYKLMHPLLREDAQGIPCGVYTTAIGQDELDAHLESVRAAPCLFQALVPKRYELRINVIGEHVWAAAIHSQDSEQTKIDFRYDAAGCRHAPVLIPVELEAMCLQITRRLGLRMSNIDMILTPEGDYVFLEANPNGQWAWVEEYTGLPLTQALVDELLGVETLADHPYLKRRIVNY